MPASTLIPARRFRAQQIVQPHRRPSLESLFAPKSVAIIGASDQPGTVGSSLVENVDSKEFGGAVYLVNPFHSRVFGRVCYPSVAAVPDRIDLAVIATPAPTVPHIISECVESDVGGAIIISAGFRESGPAGIELENQLMASFPRHRLRILGPNCLGVMFPHTGLNASFAAGMARPGNLGFISQSGALCTAILDWSFQENVGFSAFISAGSMTDVGWGDLIFHLGDDPLTKSILLYMESVGDARLFLSAVREVALSKPIIVLKVGRSEGSAKAVSSHTGSLTGSDKVFDAALRRVGALRVETIEDLFDMAEVLAKQPRPKGPRLGIITNGGGPGALAADALLQARGELPQLAKNTEEALNQFLPKHWSHNNPVDILGDAPPDVYLKTAEIVAKDPNNDGLLVILSPQAMTDAKGTAENLRSFGRDGKPILASWMGGVSVKPGKDILKASNIPTFAYPDNAARLFSYMWRYSYNLKGLYETPIVSEDEPGFVKAPVERVERIIFSARKADRLWLSRVECNQILKEYAIPTVPAHIAKDVEEAVCIAKKTGFPVALKVYSFGVTHKSEVGGVKLNLCSGQAVRRAWREIKDSVSEKVGARAFLGVTVEPMVSTGGGHELIVGSSIDAQFGPVILFGSGGLLVEILQDYALALPPLNVSLAYRLMEQTKVFGALMGVREQPSIHLRDVAELLVRFSWLVVNHPQIKEIDINPMFVSPIRMVALDVRICLHEKGLNKQQLPRPSIRPYPLQYISTWKTPEGQRITFRPIRPGDESRLVAFHRSLSADTVHGRYFTSMKLSERISHERLTRICFTDYDREIVIVAAHQKSKAEEEIVGVGRLSKSHALNEAEFALVVADTWQGRGMGSEMLKLLVHIGREEKLDRITAIILAENRAMQQVCRKAGFEIHKQINDPVCHAELSLHGRRPLQAKRAPLH